mmetsp:Transcript_29393/g.44420  ORF Transcript_29393/g.44420 Transcript_29393/m.44420 type:complete len:83 (-) Transcript_29393:1369-1617(-)
MAKKNQVKRPSKPAANGSGAAKKRAQPPAIPPQKADKTQDSKQFLKVMQTKQDSSRLSKNSLASAAKSFEPTNLINKQIELS